MLYPNVNEELTPLPRVWSTDQKCPSIHVNNLRVHYKGVGKSHSDAASIRTTHPVPGTCGLYYFEVKIISKGRDGYMGIGLTAQNFKANRLPGWDKGSYGYHGDDGNSFCSSGNGQPYGPTFTTGDIIGCGVNLVDNTCFYTKNGHHLGIAFRDLPTTLYPTVGLQTPGEIVDANFGQEPFKFDIEDMINELRQKTKASIYNFPVADDQGDWTLILHKMVSSYLVHHGFSSTAEAFARSTAQTFNEDIASIKNRQKILKLVLSGRMGQAIEQTIRSYPGLLESNQNLLFMLKCRQFIEMVNGCDFDSDLKFLQISSSSSSSRSSPVVQTSVIQSTKTYQNGTQSNSLIINSNADNQTFKNSFSNNHSEANGKELNNSNHDGTADATTATNNNNHSSVDATVDLNNLINNQIHASPINNSDVEMTDSSRHSNGLNTDGSAGDRGGGSSSNHRNGSSGDNNSYNALIDCDEAMDVDGGSPNGKSSKTGVERMLEFGRELFQMSQRLEKEQGVNETNQKMLEDAFSLLAYSNPWASPLGWQLCPSRREQICAALNSAILESMNYSWRPPLEISIAHANELLRLMSASNIGACAFVTVEGLLNDLPPH